MAFKSKKAVLTQDDSDQRQLGMKIGNLEGDKGNSVFRNRLFSHSPSMHSQTGSPTKSGNLSPQEQPSPGRKPSDRKGRGGLVTRFLKKGNRSLSPVDGGGSPLNKKRKSRLTNPSLSNGSEGTYSTTSTESSATPLSSTSPNNLDSQFPPSLNRNMSTSSIPLKQEQEFAVVLKVRTPTFNAPTHPRQVYVTRGPNGVGFTLVSSRPVVIGAVEKESPADKVGLEQNDEIIEVDGIPCLMASHHDVIALIQRSLSRPRPVRRLMRRLSSSAMIDPDASPEKSDPEDSTSSRQTSTSQLAISLDTSGETNDDAPWSEFGFQAEDNQESKFEAEIRQRAVAMGSLDVKTELEMDKSNDANDLYTINVESKEDEQLLERVRLQTQAEMKKASAGPSSSSSSLSVQVQGDLDQLSSLFAEAEAEPSGFDDDDDDDGYNEGESTPVPVLPSSQDESSTPPVHHQSPLPILSTSRSSTPTTIQSSPTQQQQSLDYRGIPLRPLPNVYAKPKKSNFFNPRRRLGRKRHVKFAVKLEEDVEPEQQHLIKPSFIAEQQKTKRLDSFTRPQPRVEMNDIERERTATADNITNFLEDKMQEVLRRPGNQPRGPIQVQNQKVHEPPKSMQVLSQLPAQPISSPTTTQIPEKPSTSVPPTSSVATRDQENLGIYAGISHVKRSAVPKASWNEKCDDYFPRTYTDPKVIRAFGKADPHSSQSIKCFNTYDEQHQLDRTSLSGKYDVVKGVPRNPRGRTGIRGRGVLLRWGPNKTEHFLLTRLARDARGNILESNGKPLVEVLLSRKNDNSLDIPGKGLKNDRDVMKLLHNYALHEAREINFKLGIQQVVLSQAASLFQQSDDQNAWTQKDLIFQGIINDDRNTDNAWVESSINWIHADTNQLSVYLLPVQFVLGKATSSPLHMEWVLCDGHCITRPEWRQHIAYAISRSGGVMYPDTDSNSIPSTLSSFTLKKLFLTSRSKFNTFCKSVIHDQNQSDVDNDADADTHEKRRISRKSSVSEIVSKINQQYGDSYGCNAVLPTINAPAPSTEVESSTTHSGTSSRRASLYGFGDLENVEELASKHEEALQEQQSDQQVDEPESDFASRVRTRSLPARKSDSFDDDSTFGWDETDESLPAWKREVMEIRRRRKSLQAGTSFDEDTGGAENSTSKQKGDVEDDEDQPRPVPAVVFGGKRISSTSTKKKPKLDRRISVEEDVDDVDAGVVYRSTKSVYDVLKYAQQRETLSDLEVRGIKLVELEEGHELDVVRPSYIAPEGRALETPNPSPYSSPNPSRRSTVDGSLPTRSMSSQHRASRLHRSSKDT